MPSAEPSDGAGHKKELIFLDAKIADMIQDRAFRAVLFNGHGLVAWTPAESPVVCRVGDVVNVQLSPYDMSTGQIVLKKEVVAS